MNIFYLSNDPKQAAQWHMDKHCIKMVLESAMLLSTAHRILDGKEVIDNSSGRKIKRWKLEDERDVKLYKNSHNNHPSAIWVRQSNSNYIWLYKLLQELCAEYTYRYGKIHKCEFIGLVDYLKMLPKNIPVGEFTPVTPAMPNEYIVRGDSVASYRNYYIKAKQHLADWSGKFNSRPIPEWYIINNFI